MTNAIRVFGDEALRRKARPVSTFDAALHRRVADMLETMYAAQGLGLAAEQIGRDEAVCVIDIPGEAEMPEWAALNASVTMPLVLINPRIEQSEGRQRGTEGCLSFPEIFAQITRSATVTVLFSDLDGQPRQITAGGLLARAIQHELDHLNGVLLVDRMSPAQRVANAGPLRRLRRRQT